MTPLFLLKDTKINFKNLQTIRKNIIKHSPNPKKVNIVAVTKTFSFSAIRSSEKNKIFNIGESKIQETQQKTQKEKTNKKTQIHLIGHLQSNKVRLAVLLYDTIQSVDSIKILKKINKSAKTKGKTQKIFLQLNVSEKETQKGFKKTEIKEAAKIAKKLTNIKNEGIMSIGPQTKNKTVIKKKFQEVKKIQRNIQKTIDKQCVSLSLGMSEDYVVALQEGSTHLRLGTILFEGRNKN